MNNKTIKKQASFKMGTSYLRMLFLTPVAISILIVAFLFSMLLYKYKYSESHEGEISINTSAQTFYNASISTDTQALKAIMHTLLQDEKLSDLLTKDDRAALLDHYAPLFEDLRREYRITHFYFTRKDRVNLLRIHAPLRYGDVIERITMHQAVNSGSPAYGLEMGPLGTFTLRLVAPVYNKDTQELSGYVELGMEIDHVINKIQDFFDVQVFTFIHKEFLDREEWENGMRIFGLTPHWDNFPAMVLSGKLKHDLSPQLIEHFMSTEPIKNNSILYIEKQNIYYHVHILPLYDIGDRVVAQMIMLSDVTNDMLDTKKTIYLGNIIAFVGGIILIFFFYWLVGRIGRLIETNQKKLHKLATHDGLTGLYNHRTFYHILEDEIVRSQRYKHAISLLMLDIDHFKEVNDTYGHPNGDRILRDVSKHINQRIRSTDFACRYGGEEIMVVLTETDIPMAEKLAEDLRKTIEKKPFYIDNGQSINITVSIGLAGYPIHAQETTLLVSNVDIALYKAKEDGRNRLCIYHPEVDV
jgi:diguanylate cyclase (GGDEF)-like protein